MRQSCRGKLVYYYWNDEVIAKKILHHRLSFTYSRQCFCHMRKREKKGHEIAHALSYWGWTPGLNGYSKFINEGVAVCHDLSGSDYYANARWVIEMEKEEDVMDIWKNEKKYDESILYPVAGAFVYFLKNSLSPEQFRSVVKGQTIDNVKVILGSRFYTLVADFNKLMGIK